MRAKQRAAPESNFVGLLREQIRHEFTANQQYVAAAVWLDAHDLPRLAAHFYRQALEEHNHAMMMVQYMLDRNISIQIPGVDEVRNDFADVRELIATALQQERVVTVQIEALFGAARDERDYLGEQFTSWFLKEQVEEIASMNTLLTVTERAGADLFKIEEFLSREKVGDDGTDGPPAAGGNL
ncbi:MAG: bacterioferritin [Pseudonocardiales bacterium]|nr:MAG: bacterioferritin [Pseudonocardiales bacterium]